VKPDCATCDMQKELEQFKEAIRNEIRSGLDLVKSEIKAAMIEREKDMILEMGKYDVSIANLNSELDTKSKEIAKLFRIVDDIRDTDSTQDKKLAANAASNEQAYRMKMLIIAIIGAVSSILVWFLSRL